MAENRESTILEVKLDAGKVSEDLSQLVTRIAALKNLVLLGWFSTTATKSSSK